MPEAVPHDVAAAEAAGIVMVVSKQWPGRQQSSVFTACMPRYNWGHNYAAHETGMGSGSQGSRRQGGSALPLTSVQMTGYNYTQPACQVLLSVRCVERLFQLPGSDGWSALLHIMCRECCHKLTRTHVCTQALCCVMFSFAGM